jgi:hypothetical protein
MMEAINSTHTSISAVVSYLDEFSTTLDRTLVAPMQSGLQSLQNNFVYNYMTAIEQATYIEEFFPEMSPNITALVRQFQLWRKSNPNLMSSDIIDFVFSSDRGSSVITSGISAFFSTNAEILVTENVRFFLSQLIADANTVLKDLNKFSERLKITASDLSDMIASIQIEYKIDSRFVRYHFKKVILRFD